MDCGESEYLDARGSCRPCQECGPGLELSKECGYGEGGSAQCAPCHPRRFKEAWGPHGCRPCLSCSLINRVPKSNCSATSDATCGECLPGFYSKTQIGGFQDLECIPCTKQTPSSELQCTYQPAPLMESPPAAGQDLALVVLTSSALVILVLVLLTVSFLYCQRFWKSQCQRGEFPQAAARLPPSLSWPCLEAGSFPLSCLPGLDGRSAQYFRPSPLSSCATESQHHWPHAPVECTELDLQTFSARAELQATSRREDPGNGVSERVASVCLLEQVPEPAWNSAWRLQ
uniref:Ectodysplasin A2 receptor n=1 Tax=Varanus komodoensis TaxID=61221 RepID=A0A8D2KZK0_VARKO